MRRYEAMVIFPGDMDMEQLNQAVELIRQEVKAVGGEVDNVTRLGKRTFARMLQSPKKMAEGYYCLYDIRLAPDRVDDLYSRLGLREQVYRVQIVRAEEREAKAESAVAKKEAEPGSE